MDRAFKKFRTDGSGFPKFKSKRFKQSIRIPQHFKLSDGSITIPKMKKALKFGSKSQFKRFLGKAKFLTISKDTTGKYYISITCELTQSEIMKSFGKSHTRKTSFLLLKLIHIISFFNLCKAKKHPQIFLSKTLLTTPSALLS